MQQLKNILNLFFSIKQKHLQKKTLYVYYYFICACLIRVIFFLYLFIQFVYTKIAYIV